MDSVEVIRADNGNAGNICGTCVKGGECALKVKPDKPMIECEEFDTGASAEFNNSESGKLSSEPMKVGAVQGQLKGICADCSNRDVCVRAAHTGGIWDCDDYMEVNG
ncbi:hypothetical protein STSP2_03100 [Anaerohalosphaera lusitana]|uniref:Uncharacterized protein n=1 Tax=Anaerohalosphaera lusitana TaxID=1936003 RepID=A0A1U9NQK6_9BACT|nr:hypothetical protein [Anaerohalosphaera lusitana]AQT69900.1 hypothetical protein STSP2_03100 [Anaerohalosphaera lusitana]